MTTSPIEYKYREGKLKSTLKRESRGRETTGSANGWNREGRTKRETQPAASGGGRCPPFPYVGLGHGGASGTGTAGLLLPFQ